jgi:oligopeptide/dipeptide ABC transporter ATP-binding protein
MRRLRGRHVTMVFQDPMTALNPVHRVGAQIGEIISLHQAIEPRSLRHRVVELLRGVGIGSAPARAQNYPHEYSGGMRQRAVIAMGVANGPSLLIADEPTTALDVTVQDQILALMRDLNRTSGTAILLISHNLAVVASLSHRIIVMYAGVVVEEATTQAIFNAPAHPYTGALLRSVPRIDQINERLIAIPGQPPNARKLPGGCAFHPRCPKAQARCLASEPPIAEVVPGHKVRCWIPNLADPGGNS